MEVLEYILRYILCFLAIAVILNCVWSPIRLRPDKKVYAVLVDMANDKQYPITCYETSVGRSKLCDVVFTNTTVSRFHAVVALRKDGFYVFDTESKSGVYVNEKQIEKSEKLSNGDIIAFGTSIMKFYIGNDANEDYSHKNEKKQAIPKLVNIVDGHEFPLDGDFVTIGRQKGSNIELPAPYVSRQQAEVFRSKGKWYIENYSKTTKTLLNGEPVIRISPLYDGDVIKIGDFAFLYEEK
jgi:pSer/pThr/pTyr-binding forkhead associated (FHA) protein